MSWSAETADITAACLEAFGEAGVWTAPSGTAIAVPVIFHSSTLVSGELTDRLDPRPHVELPVSIVGVSPQGRIAFLGRTFELLRLVKLDQQLVHPERHEDLVSLYVREVTA
jgi:hypothetical protein